MPKNGDRKAPSEHTKGASQVVWAVLFRLHLPPKIPPLPDPTSVTGNCETAQHFTTEGGPIIRYLLQESPA